MSTCDSVMLDYRMFDAGVEGAALLRRHILALEGHGAWYVDWCASTQYLTCLVNYTETYFIPTGSGYAMVSTTHAGTVKLIDKKIALPVKTPLLSPGLHRIPFCLAALDGMPSSIKYKTLNLQGKIKYKIQAQVSRPGIFQRNLKSEAEVLLRQIPYGAGMPSQTIADVPITACWCCSNGSVDLTVVSNRNMYAPGDLILLNFSLDQQKSPNRITSVKVSLRRVLLFGTKLNAQEKEMEKVMVRVDSGPVTSNETLERGIILPIPACKYFTQKSSLIECRYEAVFEIKAAWSFTAYIRHPVGIYDSRLPDYASANVSEKRIQ